MAVTFGNVSNGPLTASIDSKTVSHTVAAGSDRLLLCAIMWNNPNGGEAWGTVSYGGVALTALGSPASGGSIGVNRVTQFYYLLNPAVGTANMVVSEDSGEFLTFFVDPMTFYGVDQTTPLGTPVTATSGSATTLGPTVTSKVGDMVASCSYARATTNPLVGPTTTRFAQFISSNNTCAGATQPGAASVTATYSHSAAASSMSVTAVNINASSSPPNPSQFFHQAA